MHILNPHLSRRWNINFLENFQIILINFLTHVQWSLKCASKIGSWVQLRTQFYNWNFVKLFPSLSLSFEGIKIQSRMHGKIKVCCVVLGIMYSLSATNKKIIKPKWIFFVTQTHVRGKMWTVFFLYLFITSFWWRQKHNKNSGDTSLIRDHSFIIVEKMIL